MKDTCSECETPRAPYALACTGCGEIFEEESYMRWLYITFLPAGILHFVLGRAEITGRGWIIESIMTGSFLLFLVYSASKFVQWLRDPKRPVLDELSSVFSDRFDRLLILGALIAVLWIGLPLIPSVVQDPRFPVRGGEPSWFTYFRMVRAYLGLLIATPFFAVVIWRQGWSFFDPRIPSVFAPKKLSPMAPETSSDESEV